VLFLAVLGTALSASAVRAADDAPWESAAPVPATRYESVFAAGAPGTEPARASRLPWRRLYRADGGFVPESELDGDRPGASAPARTASAAPQPEPRPPGGASDARAVVRSVNHDAGKVKLKHGPIQKLDMPGMTMVFRVRDPALLEGLRPGDEVGITVELDGTTFYVTGFQK
jgi:Cu/Ag efflux protein CusF